MTLLRLGRRMAPALIYFCMATNADAIPALRETRGDYDGQIVTIFPDHRDPNVFYFMPNSSEFGRHDNGVPTVGLVHWGLATPEDTEDGGGLLSFILKPAVTPAVRDELLKFKAKHAGARLSVLPIFNSRIEADTATTWKNLIASLDLPPKAGVMESEVGVNMLLTEFGARAFRGILSGSSVPFNVRLCFDVTGALPQMNAQVVVQYDKVYEHFLAQATYGALWWRSSVRAEVEKLVENRTISINILGGDANFDDYVTRLTDEFIKNYMVPTLSTSPTGGGGGAFLTFNFTYREERKTTVLNLIRQDIVDQSYCLPLAFRSLQPWADQIIVSAD